MTRGPDFIIIGAMKCATSTLHEQLAQQPGCFMSRPKEPCFFSDDDCFQRGVEWYQSLFATAPDGAICGESSTDYTKLPTHPHTVERMRTQLPNVKLVYVMRNPLDRLISHFIHEWSQSEIRVPLDTAVGQHPELTEYSLYAKQLRPYLEAFGPNNVLPVFLEQTAADSQATLERICTFIGYRGLPQWSPALERQNASNERMRKSPLRDALLDLPLLRAVRRRLIPMSIRNRVKRIWTMNERPQLTPALRTELESIFDADLKELGSWLGRELCCAGFERLPSEPVPHWSSEAPQSKARTS